MNSYFGALTPRMEKYRSDVLASTRWVCTERAVIQLKRIASMRISRYR